MSRKDILASGGSSAQFVVGGHQMTDEEWAAMWEPETAESVKEAAGEAAPTVEPAKD